MVTDRRAIYKILSVALQWPDEHFVPVVRQALHAASEASEMLSALEAALIELAHIPLEQTQAEYTKLFINNFPKTLCPPYESFYCAPTDGDALLGAISEEVVACYRWWGLSSGRELPDHIAVELEFIYGLLSALEATTDEEERSEVQAAVEAFWSEHLGRWAESFACDLAAHASLAFYRRLSEVLAEFVQTERMRWKKSGAPNLLVLQCP